MAWTYLAATEESHSLYQSGLDLSPTVKSTDTLKEFFSHGWQRESYPLHLFGTTSKPSKENLSETKSISSMEGFPVRISAQQEMVRVWEESEAGFFSDCVNWSKKYTQNSSFWKTSQPLELEDFEKSSEHLPIFGMIVGGLVYLPRKLVPHTLEKGGSYWQSPKAVMIEESYETYLKRVRRSPDPKTNTKTRPNSLAIQVKTPQFWPTPTATERSGINPKTGKGSGLSKKVGGSLNPTWVEWLQGVSSGWTELKPWAMEWYHSKSKKRLSN